MLLVVATVHVTGFGGNWQEIDTFLVQRCNWRFRDMFRTILLYYQKTQSCLKLSEVHLHPGAGHSTAMQWMGVASLPRAARGSPLFYQLHKTAPLLTITLRHYEANSQLATHTQPQVQQPSAYWSLHFDPEKKKKKSEPCWVFPVVLCLKFVTFCLAAVHDAVMLQWSQLFFFACRYSGLRHLPVRPHHFGIPTFIS